MKIKKIVILLLFTILSICSMAREDFVIQQGDEKLQLDYVPQYVCTDSAILSRFFAALGIDLVGVPNSTTKIPEKYDNTPRIGRSGMPDLEKVKALKTDLMVSTVFSKNSLKEKYDMINVPSFYLNVDTYQHSKDAIEVLGKAFNKEQKANEILDDWNKREKIVVEKAKNMPSKKVAIIFGNGESFFMVGKEHFLQELLDKVNCENIVTKFDKSAVNKRSVPFSLEQLLTINPDIILILPSSKTKNGEVFRESFDKNPVWKLTNAYKNNKIIIIDPTLFRMSSGVNSIDALEELYKYVHE